ncbi:HlyD family efflux transporter periplasmic adaptor subunit [bacterium]|nr:HlyD family efflux transporter periplasmic adaptor subunit [bacterium]NCQ54750.1 HlyD family efflux transporter periplasmic adaptor subunit [Candidatus Parcubacteria bacterium]NCS68003.1 HlyD family efflux transporter periplasmic adaptor subunit [Candidatus Peregrinibacteria bacterium]NCS95740.1 HlyD family efflux transporter periplasmic adaptor subunit [bacterium]
MSESLDQILKDSQSKKRQYLKYSVPVAALLIAASAYAFYQTTKEVEAVYVPQIYEVIKGDISSTVSSNGNIINPDIVNLSFLINGTLEKLYVKEGDKVEAGQVLADLDKRDLNFDLKSTQNDVNIAWQNIQSRQADITDTEIINASNDLNVTKSQIESNKNTTLQNLEIAKNNAESRRKTAEQNLAQTYADAELSAEEAFPNFEKALTEIDFIFGITRNYTGKTIGYKAFNDSIRENQVKSLHRDLTQSLENLRAEYQSKTAHLAAEELIQFVNKTQALSNEFGTLFDVIIVVFASSQDSIDIPQSVINSSLSTMQSLQSQIQSTQSSLSKTLQNIDKAELDLRNTLVEINNDLASSELNLKNTLTDLDNNLKNAELKVSNAEKSVNQSDISKQTSLNIQYAQLEQSKLKVEKARYNLSLATLTAPKAGTIIRINGSVGESLKADSIDAENAFIRIVSDANFTTEVYVEEIDIAKINIGQKALITLDAIPEANLSGEVSYISSIAEIDSNGIVTYLVRIDITDSQNQPIREGMTTYVDFVLGEAKDVIIIPNSALIRNRSVMLENGERKDVEVGFTDGDLIEIKSGLAVGDKIISNPQVEEGARNTGSRAGGGNLSEERLTQMKAAGFTNDELAKLQSAEITDAMRSKMQAMREAAGNIGGGAPSGFSGGTRITGGGVRTPQ